MVASTAVVFDRFQQGVSRRAWAATAVGTHRRHRRDSRSLTRDRRRPASNVGSRAVNSDAKKRTRYTFLVMSRTSTLDRRGVGRRGRRRLRVVNPATEEIVGVAPRLRRPRRSTRHVPRRRRSRRGRRPRPTCAPSCCRRPPTGCDQRALQGLLPLVIAETGCTATVGKQMQVPHRVDRFETYAAPRARLEGDPAAAAGDAGHRARAGRIHGCDRPPPARRRRRRASRPTTSRS